MLNKQLYKRVALTALLILLPQSVAASSWNPTLLVNTEAFQELDPTDTTSNRALRFGQGAASEQLYLDITNNLFNFTDDVHVEDNITASGTLTTDNDISTKADLTINSDNGAADAILTFGNDVTAETLRFSNTNEHFAFSDDVQVENSLAVSGSLILDEGQTITLNGITYTFPGFDASASGKVLASDGAGNLSWANKAVFGTGDTIIDGNLTINGNLSGRTIIASDLSDCGLLKTSSTGAFICGEEQNAVFSGSNLAAIQMRASTGFAIEPIDTWMKVQFDRADIQSQIQVLEWDTVNTGNVLVKETGFYLISYHVDHNDPVTNHQVRARVRISDNLVVTGSLTIGRQFQNEFTPNVVSVISYLVTGDHISLEVQRNTPAVVINETVLTAIKLDGIQGPSGPAGANGDLVQADADQRYVLKQGDTMTGSLASQAAISGATLGSKNLQNCTFLTSDSLGNVVCQQITLTGAFISIQTDENSNASAAAFDMFEDANYPGGTLDYTTNSLQQMTFTPADGRFTVNHTGSYLIMLNAFGNLSANNTSTYTVLRNGASTYAHNVFYRDVNETTVSLVLTLNAAEYLEFQVASDSAATHTVQDGTSVQIFSLGSIGDAAGGITQAEADVRYVNVTGDEIDGALTVDQDTNAVGVDIDSEATSGAALRIDVAGDSDSPHLSFGQSGIFDTNLFRSAADTLRTDDSLVIGNDLSIATATGCTALQTDALGKVSCGAEGGTGVFMSITTDEDSSGFAGLTNVFADASYPGTLDFTYNASNDITFDPSTGRFTIPEAGAYMINYNLIVDTSASSTTMTYEIRENGGTIYTDDWGFDNASDPVERSIMIVYEMTGADYLEFFATPAAGTSVAHAGTSVSIYKISSLPQDIDADNRYILKGGDNMTGALNIVNGAGLNTHGNITTQSDITINSDNTAADATLTFGNDATAETLRFSDQNERFEFSDDLHVTGNITTSGAITAVGDFYTAGTMSGGDIQCNNCLGQEDIGDAAVGTAELKSATSSASAGVNTNITMNDYAFFPNLDLDTCGDTTIQVRMPNVDSTNDTIGRLRIQAACGGATTYTVRWRYITASDRPAIWAIANTSDEIVAVWQGEDPISYPDNPNPLAGTALQADQRFVSLEPLSVTLLNDLYNSLTFADRSAVEGLLRDYVVTERGWLASLASVNDLAAVDPRYEPSARLWAMRFVAEHYGVDPTEIVIQTMDAGGDTLGLKTNYYNTLQNYLTERANTIAANQAATQASQSLPVEVRQADIAEIYLTLDSDVRYGDVMKISNLGPGYTEKTTSAYDPLAIGVVSTDPAFTMGEEIQSNSGMVVEVAVAGRVPVTVSTANGPIGTGDFLTSTSASPAGHAVKATADGHVIGQALQAYTAGGTGSILMFVNPQYLVVGSSSLSAVQHTANLANSSTTVATHSADTSFQRTVDVYYQDATAVDISNFDVLDSEAAQWTHENASITEIESNSVHLIPTGSVSPTTTNISLGATAIASDTTRSPTLGNDNNISTFWYNQGAAGASSRWWGVQLSAPTQILSGEIHWFSSTYAADFRVQGSTDGNNWVTLGSFTETSASTITQAWTLSTPATYQYYRYDFFNHNNGSYTVLDEGRFFEATGSVTYSTTPAYVTNGPTKRISTSNWSSVNSTTLSDGEPTNTELRYLFSFDAGTTWRSFSGGAWNTQTLSNIENVGMTSPAVDALSSANWFGTNGINSAVNETLDMAVSIRTTDSSITPSFSSLEWNVNTNPFWEKAGEADVQVRLISDTQTEVTNLRASTHDFRVNVILP